MKILQLCKKFPYPLNDGESIAVSYMSKALSTLGCEMTLLCMNTSKHYTDVKSVPENYNFYKEIYVTEIDNSINAFGAFINLFKSDSYHIERFISEEFKEKLKKVLVQEDYDIVQLETVYLAPYIETIRKFSEAKIVMRAHNVEHEIWRRITDNTTFLPKKIYLKYLTKKLRDFEVQKLVDYDYLVTVTERDLLNFKKMGYHGQGQTSPIGLDSSEYSPSPIQVNQKSLSFIGSLDWIPNLEGIEWFISEVWGKIKKSIPDAKLEVAGRNMPDKYKELQFPSVRFLGEVESAIQFINEHPIMIVPLLSGSGMRVKILEGMVLGRVVITTSVGLEGIPAKHMENVLIADTPDEFVSAVSYCLKNPDRMKTISENAKAFIKDKFDNTLNAEELLNNYYNLIDQGVAV